jgi:hypothetical protein
MLESGRRSLTAAYSVFSMFQATNRKALGTPLSVLKKKRCQKKRCQEFFREARRKGVRNLFGDERQERSTGTSPPDARPHESVACDAWSDPVNSRIASIAVAGDGRSRPMISGG